jgi:hypothetical protein
MERGPEGGREGGRGGGRAESSTGIEGESDGIVARDGHERRRHLTEGGREGGREGGIGAGKT